MKSDDKLVRLVTLELLKETLYAMSIVNYNIKISNGTEKGENLAGIIAAVDVDGYNKDGNRVQHYFIIKSSINQDVLRQIVFLEEMYIREVYIYSHLLKEFTRIQQTKKLANCFQSYPAYYNSCLNYEGEAIILENMKAKGYKKWNQKIPANLSHVTLVMKELGRFHALSFAIRNQEPELFNEIVKNTQETFFQNFRLVPMLHTVKHRINVPLQILDPVEDKTVFEKYKQFAENGLEVLGNCINSKYVDQYAVINHGDCSINNFLFKYDDLEDFDIPTKLCFLDWQMSRLGSPALDITCFIFSCTDTQFRQKYYNNMINEYYSSLSCMLTDLGSDVDKMFPFVVFHEHLKNYSIFGMFMAIMLLHIQCSDNNEIPNFSEVSKKDLTESFVYDLSQPGEFNSKVRDLILDFDKLGYQFVPQFDSR